jgi:hypothetical protein
MDSYFIPKIEDLKENYQFEYQEYDEELDIFKDNWIKTNFDSREGLGHDLTYQFQSENVRCEFLTKEQIENEGWEFTEQINNRLYFRKGAFVLTFEDDYINIDNTKGQDIGYWGKCKDINTFKYIYKLLEI